MMMTEEVRLAEEEVKGIITNYLRHQGIFTDEKEINIENKYGEKVDSMYIKLEDK